MSANTQNAITKDTLVLEWAPFRLAPGVDENTLLRASDEFQESFVKAQPGFVRRELIKAPDGGWVDLVLWKDQASADAVMQAAAENPLCAEYFKLLAGVDHNDPTAGVLHFQRLRQYGR